MTDDRIESHSARTTDPKSDETGEIAGLQRIENGVESRQPSVNPSHRLECLSPPEDNTHQ